MTIGALRGNYCLRAISGHCEVDDFCNLPSSRGPLCPVGKPSPSRPRPSACPRSLRPTELRRLRDAALTGLRSADWGSEIGRLHLTNRLNSAELSTAKRWFELVNAYSIAYRSPTQPRSVLFDVGGGQPSDPTSEEAGLREAKKMSGRSPTGFKIGMRCARPENHHRRDTIDIDGVRIRIVQIDTPETFGPRCENELISGFANCSTAAHVPRKHHGGFSDEARDCDRDVDGIAGPVRGLSRSRSRTPRGRRPVSRTSLAGTTDPPASGLDRRPRVGLISGGRSRLLGHQTTNLGVKIQISSGAQIATQYQSFTK